MSKTTLILHDKFLFGQIITARHQVASHAKCRNDVEKQGLHQMRWVQKIPN
jgi:hypothetical protein